jgi:hypothetical protein
MLDVVLIGGGLVFFVLSITFTYTFTYACDRL